MVPITGRRALLRWRVPTILPFSASPFWKVALSRGRRSIAKLTTRWSARLLSIAASPATIRAEEWLGQCAADLTGDLLRDPNLKRAVRDASAWSETFAMTACIVAVLSRSLIFQDLDHREHQEIRFLFATCRDSSIVARGQHVDRWQSTRLSGAASEWRGDRRTISGLASGNCSRRLQLESRDVDAPYSGRPAHLLVRMV